MKQPVALTTALLALLLGLPQAALAASPPWAGGFASARPGWASVATSGSSNGVDFSLAIRGQSARAQGPSGVATVLASAGASLVELAIRVGAPADPEGELADPDAWSFFIALNEGEEEAVEPASAIEEAPGGRHPGASVLRFRLFTPAPLQAGSKVRWVAQHPLLGRAFNPTLVLGR